MDKAHPLECRSRTPRNTDGLASLLALPLNDLRGEIKQEELPARVLAERDVFWLCFVKIQMYLWQSVYTFDAVQVYLLLCICSLLLFRGDHRPVCIFSYAWLTVRLPANVYVCVSKQDPSESIHLGCRAQCAVTAE